MTSHFPTISGDASRTRARIARRVDTDMIARCALRSLLQELETWPKPGLMSHIDNGCHVDKDANLFRVGAFAIAPYFKALAEAGAQCSGMGHLRVIGLEAEAAMFAATGGINTHRGAIFGLGLLCAAAGARSAGHADPHVSLGNLVARRWKDDILEGPILLHSDGSQVRRRYGVGGARLEAAHGFPSVYQYGLPALSRGMRSAPFDVQAQRVEACFALIAAVVDTNLLHRSGLEGLRFARAAAEEFLDRGGVGAVGWREHAERIHESFVAQRLNPGASANLLAMTLFVDTLEAAARR